MRNINIYNYMIAYVKNVYGFFISKKRINYKPNKYNENYIMNINEGEDYIKELIKSNKPFVVSRFGSTELGCFHNFIKINLGIKHKYKKSVLYSMRNNAGFFPANDKYLSQYSELMQSLYRDIDMLAVFNIFMEDYIVDKFCEKAKLTELATVDPILTDWVCELQGKKVLVIHPYAKLIKSQYEKRQLLFKEDKIPEFNLSVFKAVQTIAGADDERFQTWFEALEYMMEEISKIDFDIALIGAGAYGLPLAVKIKNNLNKQAIHIGGATQLMFGIKGKRWDNIEPYNKYYNDQWVRPDQSCKPNNFKNVESGCYW